MTYVPSEDSDQHGHTPTDQSSLGTLCKAKDPQSLLLHVDSEDWSEWADESLLGALAILLVLLCSGSIINKDK